MRGIHRCWPILFVGLAWTMASVAAARDDPARVAIIIDDLGNARSEGARVAALPGPVACSVLPHTPYAAQVAEWCTLEGKEVFLHLPMQPDDPGARPGPGALLLGQSREELRAILSSDLASVPGVSGINNHMGSLLTRHIAYMDWLMAEIAAREGLLFVDSATTAYSVAQRLAESRGLATIRRDVFLDEDPSPEAVRGQWEKVLQIARSRGAVVAIGHPRPATLALLAEELEAAGDADIMFVGVADLVRGTAENR